MKINNLVFSGGNIKALVYIGCLQALEEYNLLNDIKTIAGTSAGGIFALLINLGYTSKELKNLSYGLDFSIFKDITTETILAFITNYGIDTGNKLLQLIKILIKKKVDNPDITFQELFDKTNQKLILTGTCLTKNKVEYFSYKTFPNMKIIDAIRITFSIPLIYNKVEFEKNMYIDGAIMDNYPIQIFKQYKENTLGFVINTNSCNDVINDITGYIKSILSCINCRLKHYQQIGFEEQTVELKINIKKIDFNLTSETKEKLLELGYQETKKYIDNKVENSKTNKNMQENDVNDNVDKYDYNLEKEIEILLDDLESGNF